MNDSMSFHQRVECFKDTINMCVMDEYLSASIIKSCKEQIIYMGTDSIVFDKTLSDLPAKLIVSKKRTFKAASTYKGKKVCVLNFANAYRPGGGVENGASAQEESLCRCSTLYPCISCKEMVKDFYCAHKNDGAKTFRDMIYTPEVVVFKDDENEMLMNKENWFHTDVITCAAPNLSWADMEDDELMQFHEFMFERMFKAAAMHGAEVMILGAFGCGVFNNDPKIVSKAAKNIIERFSNYFDTIEFAIFCKEYESENYIAFRDQFRDQHVD